MLLALVVRLSRLLAPSQRAQAMVEYALILVLIAVVVIAVLVALGAGITNTFQTIVNSLE